MTKTIVHVADIEVNQESGMGRVAWHWKQEIERRGYQYIHIGPSQVGTLPHRGLFPYAAYRAYHRLGCKADAFLVHEASSGPFLNRKTPAIVFSHGSDRRSWNMALQNGARISLKARIIFPLWRLRHCDLGYRKSDMLLVLNKEDMLYAQEYYHRDPSSIYIFKNGVDPSPLNEQVEPNDQITISFIATWSKRKGIETLVKAGEILHKKGLRLNWLLAGTGGNQETILNDWGSELHPFVEVIPSFKSEEEENLLARTSIFVLPSFYEGQPLSLLQAMETGRCCITTNCCGQRDLIQQGENGLLYEPGDFQELASLIEKCANDKDLRIRLGKNAKLSMNARTWDKTTVELFDHIESALL